MKDQASRLREMAQNVRKQIEVEMTSDYPVNKRSRVIVISSGKGGVGKSTLALNLSVSLSSIGKKVVLMDADLGMANIDIMLGMVPEYNLFHMIQNQKNLQEIMINGPEGLKIIPGGSGMEEMANLSDSDLKRILVEMGKLDGEFDYMIVDTGAGISSNVMSFVRAADDVIIVTTPEPTSITDAYGLLKSISRYDNTGQVYLIINRVSGAGEGQDVARKFKAVSQNFLGRDIKVMGYIVADNSVEIGIKKQVAFSQAFPRSLAARDIMDIAERIADQEMTIRPFEAQSRGIRGFIKKFTSFQRSR